MKKAHVTSLLPLVIALFLGLGGITAPILVVVGDADVIRPEHAVETFRLLPQARLAVLPGTDHMHVTERTNWLVPMIEEFLDASKGQ